MRPAVVAGADPVAVPLMARDAVWSAWACLRCRRGVVLLSAEFSVDVSAGWRLLSELVVPALTLVRTSAWPARSSLGEYPQE